MGDDETGRRSEGQASTASVGVLERLESRFPRVGRVIVGPVRAIVARYEDDELPTHAGALTYGAFLSLPPLLLLAASAIGFAIREPAKQERVIDSLLRLIQGLDAVAASLVAPWSPAGSRWGSSRSPEWCGRPPGSSHVCGMRSVSYSERPGVA